MWCHLVTKINICYHYQIIVVNDFSHSTVKVCKQWLLVLYTHVVALILRQEVHTSALRV